MDFGDFRRGPDPSVLQRFSAHVARRWAPGSPIATAVADMRGQGFVCAPGSGRGNDPPDQACRRTVAEGECTYIWQVFVFDDAGAVRVSRVRALYNRRCGRDGLAGGPD